MSASIKEVSLDDINIEGGTQTRAKVCEATVKEYSEAISEGDELPPVDCVFDGKTYWLWDGFHRVLAYGDAGIGMIAVRITRGSKTDAQWLACSANRTHGLKRTNADKREAVKSALALKPNESDRAIAEHVGVSDMTVGRIRKEQVQQSGTCQKTTTRTGRDGKQYPASKPAPEPSKWDASEPKVIRDEQPDWTATDDDEPVFSDDDWNEAEDQETRLKAAKAPYLRSLKALKAFHDSIIEIIESDEPGCAWIDERGRNGWKFDVDKLAGQIRVVMPEVACPKCEAAGCETCRKSGFVSKRFLNRMKETANL